MCPRCKSVYCTSSRWRQTKIQVATGRFLLANKRLRDSKCYHRNWVSILTYRYGKKCHTRNNHWWDPTVIILRISLEPHSTCMVSCSSLSISNKTFYQTSKVIFLGGVHWEGQKLQQFHLRQHLLFTHRLLMFCMRLTATDYNSTLVITFTFVTSQTVTPTWIVAASDVLLYKYILHGHLIS